MYLEEETSKKSEVISCIFSLKEEVGALAKALRLFEVNISRASADPVKEGSPNELRLSAACLCANTTGDSLIRQPTFLHAVVKYSLQSIISDINPI